jgi:hypothetical protein
VPQTKYVVVCSDGTSYDLSNKAQVTEWGKPKKPRFDLEDLLAAGWSPVRETGMGGGEHAAYALVVLQKDATG